MEYYKTNRPAIKITPVSYTHLYEAPEEIPIAQFRKLIGSVFPKYMIPNRFVHMTELPRNTNGKIDRLKLKELVQ